MLLTVASINDIDIKHGLLLLGNSYFAITLIFFVTHVDRKKDNIQYSNAALSSVTQMFTVRQSFATVKSLREQVSPNIGVFYTFREVIFAVLIAFSIYFKLLITTNANKVES